MRYINWNEFLEEFGEPDVLNIPICISNDSKEKLIRVSIVHPRRGYISDHEIPYEEFPNTGILIDKAKKAFSESIDLVEYD